MEQNKKNELILVVDDDPEIRQMLQFRLEKRGYRVLTAADGEQALAEAAKAGQGLLSPFAGQERGRVFLFH